MKTIIITGGTSGIGLDIANFFYKKKYNVAIAGELTKSQLVKLKKIFSVNQSLILSVDLIKKNNIKKFINLTKKKFKKIDILVNCA